MPTRSARAIAAVLVAAVGLLGCGSSVKLNDSASVTTPPAPGITESDPVVVPPAASIEPIAKEPAPSPANPGGQVDKGASQPPRALADSTSNWLSLGFIWEALARARSREEEKRAAGEWLTAPNPDQIARAEAKLREEQRARARLTSAQPLAPSAEQAPGAARSAENAAAAAAAAAGAASAAASAYFAAESGKVDSLVSGSAAVSAPDTGKVGDDFFVYLRVSPEQLGTVLEGLQTEFPENKTLKGKAGIKLTPRMTASLSGLGFEIMPKDGQTQAVSGKEATTWQWQVEPVESGLLTLTFTLSGALTVEGKEVARNFYQYRQKVTVAVSPMSFVEKNWQWLATSIAIPLIGALWAMFRKPKDAAGKPKPSFAQRLRLYRRAQSI